MVKTLSKVILFSLCLCMGFSAIPASYAFDLFNQDRGKKPPAPPPPPPPTPPKKSTVSPPIQKPPKPRVQTDFGLQGTSQLGQNFRAILLTPKNQVLKINWTSGSSPVDLIEGFRLLEIRPREAVVEYPATSLCREDRRHKGVSCSDDGKTATLRLVLGKATPMKAATRGQPVTNKPATIPVVNAAQNNQANKAAQARARETFKPNSRIKPEDVPPGMRIVKTPFGDRLVPIKK